MPTEATFLLFAGVALVLLLVPGPAVIYIVTTAATSGRRAGLLSVAGIHAGTFVHIGAAVLGLSAIVATSATAFTVVKLAGAAYLIVVGLSMVLGKRGVASQEVESRDRGMSLFARGFLVNLLNPKTAVFFLAFVPQFVDETAGNETTQLLALGLMFVALGLITDGLYALLAGWMGPRLLGSPALMRRKNRVAGVIYTMLGVTTAVSGSTK